MYCKVLSYRVGHDLSCDPASSGCAAIRVEMNGRASFHIQFWMLPAAANSKKIPYTSRLAFSNKPMYEDTSFLLLQAELANTIYLLLKLSNLILHVRKVYSEHTARKIIPSVSRYRKIPDRFPEFI